MKKLLVALAVASVALAGCNKNSTDTDNTNEISPPTGMTDDTGVDTDSGITPATGDATAPGAVGTTTTM